MSRTMSRSMSRSMSKTLQCALVLSVMLAGHNTAAVEVVEGANIADGTASFMGVNHIGISVADLEASLAFYEKATGFEVVRRETISASPTADALYGAEGVHVDVAILKAPNMLLELRAFARNRDAGERRMPAQGPGMTHTCYQSRSDLPGWDRFMSAGADPLSRGGQPIDLGGYGVTYGYAYDPDGNMMELEQLDGELLAESGYDTTWQVIEEDLWMSQVALATHDLDRLMRWYQDVLTFAPYRVAELEDNPRADEIADIDDLHILGGWFRISRSSKVLEMWQYVNPPTVEAPAKRAVTDLGYSFSFEVADLDAEYKRLSALGVEFVSAPVVMGAFREVYAHDVDGNVFALREAVDSRSPFSVRQLENLSAD